MEKIKKQTRKKEGTVSEEKIRSSYVEFVLTNGHRPPSVYKFCLDLGISEDVFYQYAGSFDGLENDIWKGFMDRTILRLRNDKPFSGFTTREKVLAFYYTLLEELKSHRSYVLWHLEKERRPMRVPAYLAGFKEQFETFLASVLEEGKGSGEVAHRPILDSRYPQLFWLHMGFILLFWKDDNSAGFEKTDAAIEKSVNLAFDLIGKGAVDSTIEFAKFLFQSK